MNKEFIEKLKYEVSAGEYSIIKTKDLETAINYIENSISKETIKEKIEEIEITRKYTAGAIVSIKTILQELIDK